MKRNSIYLALFAGVFLLLTVSIHFVSAEDPSSKIHLFSEDVKKTRDQTEKRKEQILAGDKSDRESLDVQAPSIRFDTDNKTLITEGGLLLSGKGIQVQADKGTINTETKDAHLEGNVVFAGMNGVIEASSGDVNLEEETGQFKDGSFLYENGGYKIDAKNFFKLSETRYKLFDAKFTTCNCIDGLCPWSVNTDEAKISQEGYAQLRNATLWFHGVPVFYSPYLAFPAKFERATGLLAPTFGYSSKDGFQYKQKSFIALDDSTDLLLAPFTETKTRNGADIDFKKSFSKDNNIDSRIIYSNEGPRGSDLRGTRITDLADPTIDTNRFGIYYNHLWRAGNDAPLPFRFIADVHHVSDGLMVKELADGEVVDSTSRVATSTAILRSSFGEYFSGELLAEYNEAIYGTPSTLTSPGTQDLMFQKAPEASLSFLRSFRPIQNPYGLRLVTRASLVEDFFTRDTGYDGTRTSFNPSATIPFHVSNYFSGSIGGGAYINGYSLNDATDPVTHEDLDSNQTSKVPYLIGSIGTSFERPYELPEGNWLTYATSMGTSDQDQKLIRVKHVIEPLIKYTLVPDITQDSLPRFDGMDNISERSLVTYGVKTSLLGRFTPRKDVATGVPEFTPELRDFPMFDGLQPLPEYGAPQNLEPVSGDVSLRDGEIRSLLDLSISQGYDFRKAYRRQQETDQGIKSIRYPYTDITTSLGLTPTRSFGLKINSYYNDDESRFTGWGLASTFRDDRGDGLTLGYSYVGPAIGNPDGNAQIDQVTGGLEAVLTERLKVGYYTQYSNVPGERGPITNRLAFRLLSACNCWHMDVGYTDKTNPDKQLMYLTFTFTGLGDISQELFSWGQNSNGR